MSDFYCMGYAKVRVTLHEIKRLGRTQHMSEERLERLRSALELNGDSPVMTTFRVDRGHRDGYELHCVTGEGIIFVLNERKYRTKQDCFITVLLARPGQVTRLYDGVGKELPEFLIHKCMGWQKARVNK